MTSRIFPLSLLSLAALFLCSCAIDESGNLVLDFEPATVTKTTSTRDPIVAVPTEVEEEQKGPYYSPNHDIMVNERVLAQTNSSNSRIEIDLGEQRARIYKTGGGTDLLAIETQISTGKDGHTTPTGSFRITEKSTDKKSNLYGKWISKATGNVVISDGDSRKPPKTKSTFKGAPMPYWMRVTGSGIGMHIGYVPDYPASHGCIRVPKQVQPLIFSKTRVGTPVRIMY